MNAIIYIPYLIQTNLVSFCDSHMLGRIGAVSRPMRSACGNIAKHTLAERTSRHQILTQKIEKAYEQIDRGGIPLCGNIADTRPTTATHYRRCTHCNYYYKIRGWVKRINMLGL